MPVAFSPPFFLVSLLLASVEDNTIFDLKDDPDSENGQGNIDDNYKIDSCKLRITIRLKSLIVCAFVLSSTLLLSSASLLEAKDTLEHSPHRL